MADRLQRLGWRPDLPDMRDYRAAAAPAGMVPADIVDLRTSPFMPPIVDQHNTSSCVGNGTASIVRFMRKKLGLPDFQPSRMFIYYFARRLQGWENDDDGCMPRDAMKVLVADGVCDEAEWPFDEAEVNIRPPAVTLHDALAYKTLKYTRMRRDDDLYHLKHSLEQQLPFVLGISVYSSFYDTGSDGIVKMPRTNEILEGGHLMAVVGYSDSVDRFIVANSWGGSWGDKGVCYLPYEYLRNEDLSDDFWRIETTT